MDSTHFLGRQKRVECKTQVEITDLKYLTKEEMLKTYLAQSFFWKQDTEGVSNAFCFSLKFQVGHLLKRSGWKKDKGQSFEAKRKPQNKVTLLLNARRILIQVKNLNSAPWQLLVCPLALLFFFLHTISPPLSLAQDILILASKITGPLGEMRTLSK